MTAHLLGGHVRLVEQLGQHHAGVRSVGRDRRLLCIYAIHRRKGSARLHYCQLYGVAQMAQAQSDDMSIVGERIKTLREKKRWSQGALAKRAGIASQTVMRIESGETPQPTQKSVERIARALGVPYAQLWGTQPLAANEPHTGYAFDAPPAIIDVALLTNVIEATQAFAEAHGLNLTARRKAEIAAFLYEHYLVHGAMEERAFVNFMQLVVQK
jgi:transcriptional regulator with XRE-family HTH domain